MSLGLQALNPGLDVEQAKALARSSLNAQGWEVDYLYLGAGIVQFDVDPLVLNDSVYLVGFNYAAYRQALHESLVSYALLFVGATLAVAASYWLLWAGGRRQMRGQPRMG